LQLAGWYGLSAVTTALLFTVHTGQQEKVQKGVQLSALSFLVEWFVSTVSLQVSAHRQGIHESASR